MRKTTPGVSGLIVVEGIGCALERERSVVHGKKRRHDVFAAVADLVRLLLHQWQHERATRSAAAAPIKA
jgi:hypothetical protein